MKTVISLCDLTGTMVLPWVRAGYRALLVDPQHGTTTDSGGVVRFAGTIADAADIIGDLIRRQKVAAVFGFPPCTDMSVSGARWFKGKLAANPDFYNQAVSIAEQCRTIGKISGAPWFVENPKTTLSGVFGPAHHKFHPWHYNGIEPADNYTKDTWLWSGGGFKMPEPVIDDTLGKPDNRIHFASPGPERANLRSATPAGFAQAVYEINDI